MKINPAGQELQKQSVESDTSSLFSPLRIKDITLKNRIGVSPMCQYKSIDGFASDWHLVHLGCRAVGGAGLVITEATAVEPIGRISPDDLGIYKDEHVDMLGKITDFIEQFGAVPGIQLAHAGRKASTLSPWKAPSRHKKVNVSKEEGGWDVVGPSDIPFSADSKMPRVLSVAEIKDIQDKFRQSARRALQAGFKWLEVHAAHGYLLNSFYSPLSNFRTDEYGGSFENRVRFLMETVMAVRQEWPDSLPLSVRISATDWVKGGWSPDDSVELAKILRASGVDLVDCSSGNVRGGDTIPFGPNFQVPLAEKIRKEAGILTAAVGLITEPEQAEAIVRTGQADIVLLARAMMRNPYWPLQAAQALGLPVEAALPSIYSYAL